VVLVIGGDLDIRVGGDRTWEWLGGVPWAVEREKTREALVFDFECPGDRYRKRTQWKTKNTLPVASRTGMKGKIIDIINCGGGRSIGGRNRRLDGELGSWAPRYSAGMETWHRLVHCPENSGYRRKSRALKRGRETVRVKKEAGKKRMRSWRLGLGCGTRPGGRAHTTSGNFKRIFAPVLHISSVAMNAMWG